MVAHSVRRILFFFLHHMYVCVRKFIVAIGDRLYSHWFETSSKM